MYIYVCVYISRDMTYNVFDHSFRHSIITYSYSYTYTSHTHTHTRVYHSTYIPSVCSYQAHITGKGHCSLYHLYQQSIYVVYCTQCTISTVYTGTLWVVYTGTLWWCMFLKYYIVGRLKSIHFILLLFRNSSCSVVQCTLYSVQYTVQCTVYTVQYMFCVQSVIITNVVISKLKHTHPLTYRYVCL